MRKSFRQVAYAATSPLIGAHRGASCVYPENTIEAFHAAASMGADFLELDVRLTRDGFPVVIHDDTIDRTTSGTGAVSELTLAQITGMAPIPSLEQVFAIFHNTIYFNIELKSGAAGRVLLEKVLHLLDRYALTEQVILSSFDHTLLAASKQMSSNVLTGLLYESRLPDPIEQAIKCHADALHPFYRLLSRRLAAQCREAGLLLFPWTVDKGYCLNYCACLQVNGVITNKPDYAIKQLQLIKPTAYPR